MRKREKTGMAKELQGLKILGKWRCFRGRDR